MLTERRPLACKAAEKMKPADVLKVLRTKTRPQRISFMLGGVVGVEAEGLLHVRSGASSAFVDGSTFRANLVVALGR